MFGRGLVVGKFAPLHAGHQLLIETAMDRCERVTALVYARPDYPGMPQAVRAGWLRAIYPALDVREPHDPPPDAADDETHRRYVKTYLAREGVTVDAVFTSEDYGPGFAAVLGVPHVEVDRLRLTVPARGTDIRREPAAHAHLLHPLVRGHLGLSG